MFDHINNHEKDSLKIDREKLIKFQEWCTKNELNYSRTIEKFIDLCVENNPIILETIVHNESNWEDKLNSLINKSLQSLINRIETLESEFYAQKKESKDNLVSNSWQNKYGQLSSEDINNIIYLTRQQVWQKLKKTDYIKYAGYDSFLKAKSDQFIEYGIFFDDTKKRFYIINNN